MVTEIKKKASKKIVSKRIPKEFVNKNGLTIVSCYCRRCRMNKKPTAFYKATDAYIDTNLLMSICADCCNDIYNDFYRSEMTDERALLKTCRLLNIKYDSSIFTQAKAKIESRATRGHQVDRTKLFSTYKATLGQVVNTVIGDNPLTDLCFVEPDIEYIKDKLGDNIDGKEYYEKVWSKGLDYESYIFLEEEFARWNKSNNFSTYNEEVLIKEICHKQNEIRKARIQGKSVDGLVKALQDIMKSSALTPALQNAASAGRNAECFGVWLKDIEQLSPAEWYSNQDKYKDMDGLSKDIEDIKRSIGNFITGSREFNTADLEEINELDDDTIFDAEVVE